MKGRYEEAAKKIEATVTEMYRLMDIGHVALSLYQGTEQRRQYEVLRQRQKSTILLT